MSAFYTASPIAGAFSGLLAAAIANMNGIGGYEGWRWIFIIEGIASVLAGIATFLILPDPPGLTKWLTPDDRRFLECMHRATRGPKVLDAQEPRTPKKKFRWGVLWKIVTDWQLYLQALVMMSNSVTNFGLKVTMPQIIRNMGFTSQTSQLLTAPPYICGCISTVILGYLADRFTWRMPFLVGCQSLLIIAYAVLFTLVQDISANIPACYFSVFLACIGIYPIMPGGMAWTVNNLANAEKRAMGVAFMTTLGDCGGLIGSFIFLEMEKPKYPTGFGASMAFAAAGLAFSLTLEFLYWTSNKRNEKLSDTEIRERYTDEQLDEMGDRSPLFKYDL